jgi:hypothetical protein
MTGLLTTLYPGFFPVDVLDAAMPETALPKLYLVNLNLPIVCQNSKKTFEKTCHRKLN